MPKLALAVTCAVIPITAVSSPASAAETAPPDPSSNFTASPTCSSAAGCLNQAIDFLDAARARLGQPAYQLPGNFSQLSPSEQVFVLADLDRILYGLQPVVGLTADLNASAAAGVRDDLDPVWDMPSLAMTSNWAGGYPNLPLAYEAWMYDDGPGGASLDCLAGATKGCWGHRHNILWRFTGGSAALAMGAAAGADAHGSPGEAMLLVQATTGYRPSYLYTWAQAVAAGAGGGATAVSSARYRARTAQAGFRITLLRVRAHSLTFRVLLRSGALLRCSLTRLRARAHFRHCGPASTYRRLRPATYRLRLQAAHRTLTRLVLIT